MRIFDDLTIAYLLKKAEDAAKVLLTKYLPLSAGSKYPLTGDLLLQKPANPLITQDNTSTDTSTAPSSNQYWSNFHRDKNGEISAFWQTIHQTSGVMQTALSARRKVNGSNVDNAINLQVKNDGTRAVSVSSPAAWRNALGIGTSGELPITIEQGGTGQTARITITTASQIITAGANMSIVSTAYHYWGKLAHLNISLKANAAIASGAVVATLVAGKRPVDYVWLYDNIGVFYIVPNTGAVTINHTIGGGSTVYIRAVYLLP